MNKRKKILGGFGTKSALPKESQMSEITPDNSKQIEVDSLIKTTKVVKEGISFVDSSKDIFGAGIEMEFLEFLEYDFEQAEMPDPELDGMCLNLYFKELGYSDSEEEGPNEDRDEEQFDVKSK